MAKKIAFISALGGQGSSLSAVYTAKAAAAQGHCAALVDLGGFGGTLSYMLGVGEDVVMHIGDVVYGSCPLEEALTDCGENLKLLYGYRCQLCGQLIGEEFGSHIAEAHHIDYFVNSLNNDTGNQMIVCPNHHRIIHDANPVFDRRRRMYVYANGVEQRLVLNKHL